jgi:hypothetical protein
MKNILAIIISATVQFTFNAAAQQRTDVNSVDNLAGQGLYYAINGEPFVGSKFSKVVEGSPFFKDEWMKGSVTLNQGKQYHNLSLKVNLLEGTVIFLNDKNVEIEITTPIKEVTLTDIMKGDVFRFIHSTFLCNTVGKSWYNLLDSGKVQLLRNEKRILVENKPYGSATIEQYIRNQPEYYILSNGQCFKVKNTTELYRKLTELKPGFKTASTGNKSKVESDLVQLSQLFNASDK